MKKQKLFNKHHRRPRSIGGSNDEKNISIVDIRQHEAYHTLFLNYEAPVIAEILNTIWIDPNYHFICEKKSRK